MYYLINYIRIEWWSEGGGEEEKGAGPTIHTTTTTTRVEWWCFVFLFLFLFLFLFSFSRKAELFAELVGQVECREQDVRELLADGHELVETHDAVLVQVRLGHDQLRLPLDLRLVLRLRPSQCIYLRLRVRRVAQPGERRRPCHHPS